jgi:pilus assembly protein Flp/PilA
MPTALGHFWLKAQRVADSDGRAPSCRWGAVVFQFFANLSKFNAQRSRTMSLMKRMKRFLVSQDGPTAVEYAVMLALIIIVCLVAIQSLGTNTSTTFTNIANSLGS